MPRTLWLVALPLVLLASIVGCGGDGDGGEDSEPTPSAVVSDTTPLPTAVPALDSYHYNVDFAAVLESGAGDRLTSVERRVDGFFEGPDSHAFTGGLGVPGETPAHQAVIIGEDAWYREGSGPWQALPASEMLQLSATALTSAQAGFLNDAAFADKLQGLEFADDEAAGVPARRYEVAAGEVERVGSLLRYAFLQDISQLENVDLTVWVAEDTGVLLQVEMALTTTPSSVLGEGLGDVPPGAVARVTLSVELSQIDDESITISPPI